VRLEALARQRLALLRAQRSRLELERSRLLHLRASVGDPRFILIERQQDLDETRERLRRLAERQLAAQAARVAGLERRLGRRHPQAVVGRARSELGPLAVRLEAAEARLLVAFRNRLSECASSLDALSPLTVLGRGYAIATRAGGRAVRSATEVALGERLEVRLARGSLSAEVTAIDAAEATQPLPGHNPS
jgi:exodeoxyribonuclease VII large subunit